MANTDPFRISKRNAAYISLIRLKRDLSLAAAEIARIGNEIRNLHADLDNTENELRERRSCDRNLHLEHNGTNGTK